VLTHVLPVLVQLPLANLVLPLLIEYPPLIVHAFLDSMKLVLSVLLVPILVLIVRERPHLANPVQQQLIEYLPLTVVVKMDFMKLELNVVNVHIHALRVQED